MMLGSSARILRVQRESGSLLKYPLGPPSHDELGTGPSAVRAIASEGKPMDTVPYIVLLLPLHAEC
jgi:hypothetical protein